MNEPEEKPSDRTLQLVCKNCRFVKPASDYRVFVHEIKMQEEEKEVPWGDVATDPTLPRTYERECSVCNHGECVLVQIRRKDKVTLWFVCAKCTNRWVEND